ncbi:aldehyde dehydrogenase family protein [Spirosoma daeguense]
MTSLQPQTSLRSELQAIFDNQHRQAPEFALTTSAQRIDRIRRIQTWITTHETDIQQAMYSDFKKPIAEVMIGELIPLHTEIKHTIHRLNQWMKPQRVPTSLPLIGTRSYIHYEPKGNVLIIAPWNYPFTLLVRPLVMAIAAGNVAILKPSELTPHTSSLIKQMMNELFSANEVAVVEGDAVVSEALLELPFDHIYFTGSPAVGRIVMGAAAKNLASVTLELGGKSPVIVDESANVNQAAEQIAWGKYFNNGQTCISPDYVLVQDSLKESLIKTLQERIKVMYSPDGQSIEVSDSYARIVNKRHFERLRSLLDDATSKGAVVTFGGKVNPEQNFFEPTILEGVTSDMRVMQEEIFGPILPVLTYVTIADALRIINKGDKPLALYIHSRNSKITQHILERTSAGNSVVNDLLTHYGNMEIPFGGVNNSGIGKSNGFFGFQEFSNQRGVMHRDFGTIKFLYPPYTDKVKKLVNFFVKYL